MESFPNFLPDRWELFKLFDAPDVTLNHSAFRNSTSSDQCNDHDSFLYTGCKQNLIRNLFYTVLKLYATNIIKDVSKLSGYPDKLRFNNQRIEFVISTFPKKPV